MGDLLGGFDFIERDLVVGQRLSPSGRQVVLTSAPTSDARKPRSTRMHVRIRPGRKPNYLTCVNTTHGRTP